MLCAVKDICLYTMAVQHVEDDEVECMGGQSLSTVDKWTPRRAESLCMWG